MSTSKSTDHPQPDELAAMFRDAVLVLGGVFAVQGTDDETIRRVTTGLERVYRRARRERQPARHEPRLKPHPAVAALLRLTDPDPEDEQNPSSPTPTTTSIAADEFLRLPGLFRRWEIAEVLDAQRDFHIEGAGNTSDGAELFAVYRREG